MLGGSFTDTPNFAPVVTNATTEYSTNATQPGFPYNQFYPAQIASINRLATIDNGFKQQLVIVPGQYQASTATTGTERLYNRLQVQVLTADTSNGDFVAPSVSEVTAASTPAALQFHIRAGDNVAPARAVVLYLPQGQTTWNRADLTYNPATGYFDAALPPSPGVITYFAQVADAAGNVALVLDNGKFFTVRPSFPVTATLDNFNRADGSVGANWQGLTDTRFYRIAANALDVQQGGPLVWKNAFGSNQEAFITLSTIDGRSPSQGLLLKAQTGSIPTAGTIAVAYDAVAKVVRVSTLRLGNLTWTLYPSQAVTFANGDQLGARALATGNIQLYKNGALMTTITLNTADQNFFNSKGGQIGVWTIAAPNAILDNFGGGTVAP